MNDITCPHCHKSFPASKAFSHHLDEERKKFEEEKVQLRAKAEKWQEEEEKRYKQELEKQKKHQEEELRKKIEQESELKLKDAKNEAEEIAGKNRKLQEEVLEMGKMMRSMKTKQEEQEIENQKKLAAAEDAIREQAKKRAEEQAHFKVLELEKKLSDVSKVNAELQRKIEQGSQQAQGEVLELELERSLAQEFPFDQIKPVPKGIRGADILHVVRNNKGIECGVILWELKRTKSWSNDWVVKLKDDQRTIKADCAVLISQVIPDSIKHIGEIQGVIVGEYSAVFGIAGFVRNKLIEMSVLRNASENSDDKKDVLYNYVTSQEFKHRMDAIGESFKIQQDTLEAEKRWFAKKWSNQEKALRKMIDHTYGMVGELEGITGKELDSGDKPEELPGEVEVEVTVEEQLF